MFQKTSRHWRVLEFRTRINPLMVDPTLSDQKNLLSSRSQQYIAHCMASLVIFFLFLILSRTQGKCLNRCDTKCFPERELRVEEADPCPSHRSKIAMTSSL